MVYTKEFLISELQRFYYENGRVPMLKYFIKNNNYPGFDSYIRNFGKWNKALILADLKINRKHSTNIDKEFLISELHLFIE